MRYANTYTLYQCSCCNDYQYTESELSQHVDCPKADGRKAYYAECFDYPDFGRNGFEERVTNALNLLGLAQCELCNEFILCKDYDTLKSGENSYCCKSCVPKLYAKIQGAGHDFMAAHTDKEIEDALYRIGKFAYSRFTGPFDTRDRKADPFCKKMHADNPWILKRRNMEAL